MSKKNYIIVFLLSFLLGAVLFVFFFGIDVINPVNDKWIFQSYCNWRTRDTVQHYFGWLFYRNSPWEFPIGLISNMTTDDVSIIYTDSIPIVAVVCKILSPVLPETFQYLGLCSMLGFALNGAFGGLLIRKGIDKNYVCIVLSAIFVLAPSLAEMTFIATSLTGQWTILAALCLWFYAPYNKNWKNIMLWCMLVFLSMGVHLYIAAMILGIFFFSIVSDYIENRGLLFNIIKLSCGVTSAIIYLFIFGFFSGNYIREDTENESIYDVLTLFKPTDNEEAIGSFLFGSNKMTICGYLGIGIILGLVILITTLIIKKNRQHSIERTKIITCIVLMVVYYLFAITPNVYFNGSYLFSIDFPGIIGKMYAAFRINGRFIWVVMYLLDYFVIVGIYRLFNKELVAKIVLSGLLILQCIDCYGTIQAAQERLDNGYDYDTSVGEIEKQLIESHDVIYIKDIIGKKSWDIIYECVKNNKLISSFYLARKNMDVIKNEQLIYDDLQKGKSHNEILYVFYKEDIIEENYPLEIYDAGNGLCYGYVQEKE